jgi:hypothetical protein
MNLLSRKSIPTDTTTDSGHSHRGWRRGLTTLLLGIVALSGLLASAGAANAATVPPLTYSPTFECYANGTVVADRPTVQSLGQFVTWLPVLEMWTPSTASWTAIAAGPVQGGTESSYAPTYEVGSWLSAVSAVTFSASPNHYYEVIDEIYVPGTRWNYTALAFRDEWGTLGSTGICYTN